MKVRMVVEIDVPETDEDVHRAAGSSDYREIAKYVREQTAYAIGEHFAGVEACPAGDAVVTGAGVIR